MAFDLSQNVSKLRHMPLFILFHAQKQCTACNGAAICEDLQCPHRIKSLVENFPYVIDTSILKGCY